MLARQLRTPEERTRYGIALVFSLFVWLGLLVSVFGALTGVFVAGFVAIVHALFIAHIAGNGVKLGPEQLPELWQRVVSASQKLGLASPPEVYVMQSGGVLNAFATRLLSRRFVILYSQLVDACESVTPSLDASAPSELDFVIAHEIGHIACNHLSWVLLPARLVPLLGSAYTRACEYTCDACGHAVVQSIDISSRALAVLAGGPTMARRMNMDSFVAQRTATGSFWAAIWELNASHPYLPKRIAALRERERPGWAPVTPRSWVSYPLAPVLSAAAGDPTLLVAMYVVFLLAAIAYPGFEKYKARSQSLRAEIAEKSTAFGPGDTPVALPSTDDDGWLHGDSFAWRIKLPGPAWRPLSRDEGRKNNALADRWLTRPDKDAHIMIIGETSAAAISNEDFVSSVIANGKNASEKFQLVDRRPIAFHGTPATLLHTRATINGVAIESLYGLVVDGKQVFQVVAFTTQAAFASMKAEFDLAIQSFEPLVPEAE